MDDLIVMTGVVLLHSRRRLAGAFVRVIPLKR
jgi:hypothetical protein